MCACIYTHAKLKSFGGLNPPPGYGNDGNNKADVTEIGEYASLVMRSSGQGMSGGRNRQKDREVMRYFTLVL